MSRRPHLHALARRHGILPSYIDQEGRRRDTADDSYIALLAAMGMDAATESAAHRQLEADRRAAATQLIAPVHVTRARPAPLVLNGAALPGRRARPIEWTLEMRHEDGTISERSGRTPTIRLPPLPLGYHRLRLHAARRGGAPVVAEQALIVTPAHCVRPRDIVGPRAVFGLLANLYTVRSARNWGIGDSGDLRALMRWSEALGAAFVGINPLHALANAGAGISPYNPVSRLFRNVLYLDVSAVPELAETPAALRYIESTSTQSVLRQLRASGHVDYEAILALKRAVWEQLYRTFVRRHRHRDSARGRAYERYCQAQGDALYDFATYEALREHWDARQRGPGWHGWPAPYRDRGSREVARFRRLQREQIELHCYLQFALDEQLQRIAGTARASGLPIGMYQDLAIGSAADGSDTWAFRDLFVAGVSVGAPPDNYNAAGQNWGFPPLDPQRLRASGYAYYVRLLRAGLQHAGALRIDHVMGLVRQYWIPAGAPAHAGAYVAVATDDLFGILALESHRAGALIVGEDLGTVPPVLPRLLRRWGVLSTRVFYFERDRRGGYRAARHYPRRALVSANTHDLPPVAGFLEGHDLAERARLGLLPDAAALARARQERARDIAAMQRRLFGTRRRGPAARPVPAAEITHAIHQFLSSSPAVLLGIALDDLAGERESVNVPGVGVDQHPNWSRRMRRTLESLRADREVERSLRAVGRGWKKPRRVR